jgi:hypothetical protein
MGWETVISAVAGPLISKVLGGGAKAPKTDTSTAVKEVDTALVKTKKARNALLETDPLAGDLQPGMVSNSRDSLLGN